MTENRILRNQVSGRIRLTDPERISLASVAKRLGQKGLEEVAVAAVLSATSGHASRYGRIRE